MSMYYVSMGCDLTSGADFGRRGPESRGENVGSGYERGDCSGFGGGG